MKTTIFKKPPLARAVAVMALLGGLMTLAAPAQDTPEMNPAPTVEPTVAPAGLPDNIPSEGPLAQVIKLTQAGVDEVIIQTYITNSPGTFNLDSDKIIYLKDAGVPNDLIRSMIQRDTVLHVQIAAAAPRPPVTPPPTATPPTPPETAPDDATAPPTAPVTVDYFYNNLSPYGNWVYVEGYGRCWQPGVAVYNHEWQPYGDHGHWVYTDAGWYWVSDYSWGWAPFHYGRWFRNDRFGWCWYPDTVWGPSWVTWRYDNDYCGWAPLPPRAYYREGAGFVYNGSVVSVGFDFGLSADAFIFVGFHDFCDPHPFRHRIDHDRAEALYHRTTEYNHFDRDDRHGFINHGIDPARITRVTHTEIHAIPIRDTSASVGRFGHGEEVAHGGGAIIVNRPSFRDNRGNPVVDRPRHDMPARNTPTQWNQPRSTTVIGDHNNHPAPAQSPMPARTPQQPSNGFNRNNGNNWNNANNGNNGNNGFDVRNQNNENNQQHSATPEPAQHQRPAANGNFNPPAASHNDNQFNRPAQVQRPVAAPEVNHSQPTAPVQRPPSIQPRPEPPHQSAPMPAPRPVEPPVHVEPPQHVQSQPIPVPSHNNTPQSAPAAQKSGNDRDHKNPH